MRAEPGGALWSTFSSFGQHSALSLLDLALWQALLLTTSQPSASMVFREN